MSDDVPVERDIPAPAPIPWPKGAQTPPGPHAPIPESRDGELAAVAVGVQDARRTLELCDQLFNVAWRPYYDPMWLHLKPELRRHAAILAEFPDDPTARVTLREIKWNLGGKRRPGQTFSG